jgi:High potential iron-sulfur protein
LFACRLRILLQEVARMSHEQDGKSGIGRRALLRRAALLASALGVAARASVAADEKMTQKDAEYQPTPKDGHACVDCQYFQPPEACKLVKGKISPNGWCSFWGSKPPQ